jgi:hypothetical protein
MTLERLKPAVLLAAAGEAWLRFTACAAAARTFTGAVETFTGAVAFPSPATLELNQPPSFQCKRMVTNILVGTLHDYVSHLRKCIREARFPFHFPVRTGATVLPCDGAARTIQGEQTQRATNACRTCCIPLWCTPVVAGRRSQRAFIAVSRLRVCGGAGGHRARQA